MGAVIASIARTPIGKFGGAFSSFPATALGGFAIAGALERAGLAPESVDEVLFGHVIQAGAGQITARQAAVQAGIPMTVPATTINKVCLSGLTAIAEADLHIGAGLAEIVVAGGMESMTNAPHLLPKARSGYRYGDGTLVDSLNQDGLLCSFEHVIMGESADLKSTELGIPRAPQDEWSARSHQRAHRAMTEGRFDSEIVPVEVPQRRGDPITVATDEGVRADSTADSLGRLRPAFSPEGTTTAGNASQISDGGAAMVVVDRDVAAAAGIPAIAEIVAYGQTAGPDATIHERPAEALQIALDRAGMTAGDLDLIEINEAFASVAMWSAQMLGLDEEKVNVNGGAVALGHPLGASGARILVTLINELRRRGGGIGGAALCGGGGQGDALIVKVEA
jgi:acetyl-CoA C-acetyltransferase